jgi:3-oxoacyl-[acyl-carrier protein] reductase
MNKNILITGVSQGLGLTIARAVVAAGWTVYGVSRQRSDKFSELESSAPDRVRFASFDLGKTDQVQEVLFKEDFAGFAVPLHGFVNNAAMAYDDIVTNLNQQRLESMYGVNVFTPMMITKYVIRNMLLHRLRGSIVHLSSVSAHTGYKGLAMYASTKGALEAFSKNTAREWGERGIRSNCIVAGFMETSMSASLSEDQRARIYKRTSLKAATQVESVAAMAVHLLGDSAASITGQNIFVDSGTI